MLVHFDVNALYTMEEIYKTLKVGNAGGVRIAVDKHSIVKRMVVLTSTPSIRQVKENPYHDRIDLHRSR